ncbi:MAG: TrbC/VirB2 family protein [Blastomonas fulva]|uniref:TrbC/VirB2 family protein n=1 Tax=Blastomonas fulva TaxID=1550728 RepID=UPI0024E1AF45|nr:TrbC/VirB2 family protein [Blastomonas fulva]MDK2756131.1 TrbC/VirB2 family protein [Blastomonas fulva]
MIEAQDSFFIASEGAGALGLAIAWIAGVLTGSLAIAVATTAVAVIGIGMMSGRIDLRKGAATIAGCFVLFGAGSIADGLIALASGKSGGVPAAVEIVAPAPPPQIHLPAAPSQDFDPYAGAAVPVQ